MQYLSSNSGFTVSQTMQNIFDAVSYMGISLTVFVFIVGFSFVFMPISIMINNIKIIKHEKQFYPVHNSPNFIYFNKLLKFCIFLYILIVFSFFMIQNSCEFPDFLVILFFILLPITSIISYINYWYQKKINILLHSKAKELTIPIKIYGEFQIVNDINASFFKNLSAKIQKIIVLGMFIITAPLGVFFMIGLFLLSVAFLGEFFNFLPDFIGAPLTLIILFTVFFTGFIAPFLQYQENEESIKLLKRIIHTLHN